MAKRRARGLGSVYEVRAGLWACAMELSRDPKTGARRREVVYGKTQGEVVTEMRRRERTGERTSTTAPERVDSFLRRWILETVAPTLRPATRSSYESVLETHVIPEIGAVRIDGLTPQRVQRLYASMRANGVGDRTVKKAHTVLHRALRSAVRLQIISRNPAALEIDVPKYEAPEREALTIDQATALLRVARDDRFEALYVLALTTGARQGELFALRWSDVDFEARTLSIRRTLQDADNRGGLKPDGATKTKAGRRKFELAAIAIDALAAHRTRAEGEGRSVAGRDLIFSARNGEPIRRQNFMRRDFYPLLERAELPKIHFHDLRHTAATQLAAARTPVVHVAALLGHADPAITLRTYQHAFDGAAGDASQKLGELFGDTAKQRRK